MRPNSPSAVFVSLILHGFAAAIIFVTTMFVARQDRVAPVIFELVAGPPTAPDELVAPAKGNTTAQVTPKPQVQEARAKPEPEVVEKAPVKPDPSIARELKQSERVSYQEYLKKHPTPKQSTTTPPRPTAKVPRIDVTGIAGGVAGGSTANTRGGGGGNALTREEHSQLDTYISLLIQELKRAHEPPPGVNDLFEAKVTFDITAGGAIMDPRISKSSGDKAFDESVLEAFRRVRSIGPTPNRKPDTWTVTFRMREE
jgi:colicin import membrane protein